MMIKKVLAFTILLFLFGSVFSQGIKFEEGTFAQALEKAKKENKMIFMDCYTSWCGPCKMLSKSIFPQKEVGDLFNQRFVNLKVDMEKGEGPELAKRYHIKAYPTLLFLDAEGKVTHKYVGGTDVAGLLQEAKIAENPDLGIHGLEKRYNKGDRSTKLIADYVTALYKSGEAEKLEQVKSEFITVTPDDQLNSIDALKILTIGKVKYGSKAYQHIISNKEKVIELAGENAYGYLIGETIVKHLHHTCQKPGTTRSDLEEELQKCKKDWCKGLTDYQSIADNMYCVFYYSKKEYPKWFDSFEIVIDKHFVNSQEYGVNTCLYFANMVSEMELEEALYDRMIDRLGKLREMKNATGSYYYLAKFYLKKGKKKDALQNIETFLSLEKEQNGTANLEGEKLKSKIEQMK